MILHLARATSSGFEVLEVWDTKEQADRFGREVVGPAIERAGVAPADRQEPEFEEFEPRTVTVARLFDTDRQPA